jgi:membrane protease YdiL (CAAX protease family)
VNALKRITLVVLLTAAAIVTLMVDPILRQWLDARLRSPQLVNALSWAMRLISWSLPLLLCRQHWDIGSFRLRWTWTAFLVFPYMLPNLCFFRGFPDDHPWLPTLLVAMAIGTWEELIFRGYALSRCEAHPRFAICIAALAFALLHSGQPLANSITAFFVGIGFGILRVVSGSLGMCILIHGLTDAPSAGANPPDWAIIPVALATTTATLLALWHLPKLHKRAVLSGAAAPKLCQEPRA